MPSGVGTWNRLQSPDTGTWGFEASYTTPTYRFNFTSSDAELSAVKRAIGGAIIAALPETGLDEVLASLRDYYLFYLEDQELTTVGGGLALTAKEDETDSVGLAIGYGVD